MAVAAAKSIPDIAMISLAKSGVCAPTCSFAIASTPHTSKRDNTAMRDRAADSRCIDSWRSCKDSCLPEAIRCCRSKGEPRLIRSIATALALSKISSTTVPTATRCLTASLEDPGKSEEAVSS